MSNRELIAQVTGRQIAPAAQSEINNVIELFDALSVGWSEGGANRYLIAGDDHVAFVRAGPSHASGFLKMGPSDIPVVCRGFAYSMRGFIRFEIPALYCGMFITSHADDGSWYRAELTADGVRFGQLGVFDVARLHKDIEACPFFHPPTFDAEGQKQLRGRSQQLPDLTSEVNQ